MMNPPSWIPWPSQSSPHDLIECYEELSPFGKVLVLSLPDGALKPKEDAIARRLIKFVERPTPFVGIVIDLGAVAYVLSSADLGIVASTIAAWVRGWVAPCAIVMTGHSAIHLQKVLEITKLNELEQLRVVDTKESGLKHVRTHLELLRRNSDELDG
jgi:hypothetical protein